MSVQLERVRDDIGVNTGIKTSVIFYNCGFHGPNTSIVNIGDYQLSTDDFCRKALVILKGGDGGWEGAVPECVKRANKIIGMSLNGQSKKAHKPKFRFVFDADPDNVSIRFAKNKRKKVVAIGKYRVELEEFCNFASYIICGGFFGWDGDIPYTVMTVAFQLDEYLKA